MKNIEWNQSKNVDKKIDRKYRMKNINETSGKIVSRKRREKLESTKVNQLTKFNISKRNSRIYSGFRIYDRKQS